MKEIMNYKFSDISPFESFKKESTYLILFHIDKMPPHLGLVKNNKYFSITIKSLELDIDPVMILKTIKTKKIPSLIIEIEDTLSDLSNYYKKYTSLKDETISCLTPIKEYFADQFNFVSSEVSVVFDLLDKLEDDNRLIKTYQLFLQDKLSEDRSYSMNKYNYDELQSYIQTLRNKDKVNV